MLPGRGCNELSNGDAFAMPRAETRIMPGAGLLGDFNHPYVNLADMTVAAAEADLPVCTNP